ncbi:hypothetical protein C9F11_38260 [Streptomyces sp. YIM 121038]|uniref:DUF6197 family protein n=1 Tax=Streptomyces sp. YIM 121038 TaxID=2136401 RepID=UPI0011108231|nr:hypothetical protein [Streptomyces sp. YIM 121038]QCX81235.1 hypothetical protein C9F11_38260 [Streptomyces sp. YIM 121038]
MHRPLTGRGLAGPRHPNGQTTPAPPVHLDLEARLALVNALMGGHIDRCLVEFEVRTVHIPAPPQPAVTLPLPPAAEPCPYTTPVAATLHRARVRIEQGGWCTGQLTDGQGATCLAGAIHAAAARRTDAHDALAVLFETIHRDYPHAETIPAWNDAQRDPRLPLLYLDRAAALAHSRNQ